MSSRDWQHSTISTASETLGDSADKLDSHGYDVRYSSFYLRCGVIEARDVWDIKARCKSGIGD